MQVTLIFNKDDNKEGTKSGGQGQRHAFLLFLTQPLQSNRWTYGQTNQATYKVISTQLKKIQRDQQNE